MTMRPAQSLWLLAALLASVAAAELAWPGATQPTPGPAPPRDAATAEPRPAEPVGPWATTLLERPVFSPGRRPDSAPAVPGTPAPGRPEPPRLAGILMTPGGRRAIFAAGTTEGRGTVVSEGGTVGSWRVDAIRAGDVQLSGPDGRRTIRPSFSNLPPAPALAAAPQEPSLLPPLQLPGAAGLLNAAGAQVGSPGR